MSRRVTNKQTNKHLLIDHDMKLDTRRNEKDGKNKTKQRNERRKNTETEMNND